MQEREKKQFETSSQKFEKDGNSEIERRKLSRKSGPKREKYK
jgi:hypothetical protein